MSSIQQGIQAAHAQMELFVKYNPCGQSEDPHFDQALSSLYDWAESYKTMICLNGGMDLNLKEIKEYFELPENPYPWAYFNESHDAMDGMLTNVAIVLPEEIYEAAKEAKKNGDGTLLYKGLKSYDLGIIRLLNGCGLAR
jgi:hypothetical protein